MLNGTLYFSTDIENTTLCITIMHYSLQRHHTQERFFVRIKLYFVAVDKTMEGEMNELRKENQSLRAQLQGLKYENRMYKQLLDNLFLRDKQAFPR